MKEVRLWIEAFEGYIYIFNYPNNSYKNRQYHTIQRDSWLFT